MRISAQRFLRVRKTTCAQNTNTLSAVAVTVASSAIVLRRTPASTAARRGRGRPCRCRTAVLAVAGEHALEHPFDIVVAVRRLLARLRGHHRVGHQEHRDGDRGIFLDESEGEAQAVVAPLGAVGRVVEDEQDVHWRPLCAASSELRPEVSCGDRCLPAYSPSTRRRSSNSSLSISPRAKRSLRMSSGVRPGGDGWRLPCHWPAEPTDENDDDRDHHGERQDHEQRAKDHAVPASAPPHHMWSQSYLLARSPSAPSRAGQDQSGPALRRPSGSRLFASACLLLVHELSLCSAVCYLAQDQESRALAHEQGDDGPERNVSAAIEPIAHDSPKRSAMMPAESAPIA